MTIRTFQHTASCYVGDFSCPFGRALFCLNDDSKCDGRAICPDQADEKNCGMSKYPVALSCRRVVILPTYYVHKSQMTTVQQVINFLQHEH